MAVSVGRLITLGGETITIDPPFHGSQAVADLQQRAAICLGVTPARVRLMCNTQELSGSGSLDEILDGNSVEDIRVLVRPPYEDDVAKARTAIGLVKVCGVEFPEPRDICINMMPFILGDKTSIPEEWRHYWPLIQACPLPHEEIGKVGFLTIHESLVTMGQSQRRKGLHIEAPGVVVKEGRVIQTKTNWGRGYLSSWKRHRFGINYHFEQFPDTKFPLCDAYTGLHTSDYLKGGIYTASTVANSCRAWNMRILEPEHFAGPLGDIEPFREFLGEGTLLEPSALYWMSDATPHESLPLSEDSYRQYFRLVTSSVSVWYSKHSTQNPLGIQPDPQVTQILSHDKFLDLAKLGIDSRPGSHDEVWYLIGEHSSDMKLLRYRLRRAGLTSAVSSRGSSVEEEEEQLAKEAQRKDRQAKKALALNKLLHELARVREIKGLAEEWEGEEQYAVLSFIDDLKKGKQLDAEMAQLIDMQEEQVNEALASSESSKGNGGDDSGDSESSSSACTSGDADSSAEGHGH